MRELLVPPAQEGGLLVKPEEGAGAEAAARARARETCAGTLSLLNQGSPNFLFRWPS